MMGENMSKSEEKNQNKIDRRKALSILGGGSLATLIAGVFSPSEQVLKGEESPIVRSNEMAVKREKRG